MQPRVKAMEAIGEIQELAKRLFAIDAQISHGADWHVISERIKRWQEDVRVVVEAYLKPKEHDTLDRAVRNAFSAGGITTDSLHAYVDTLLETLSRKPEWILAQTDRDADAETSVAEPPRVEEDEPESTIPEPPPVVMHSRHEISTPEPPVAAESYEDALIPKHPVSADAYERTPIPEPPVAADRFGKTPIPEPPVVADSYEETSIPERRVVGDRLIQKTRRVLIIHDHDEANLQTLISLLSDRYSLKPLTLKRELKGKALIEKFEQAASSSSFAFVIMSPEDEAGAGKGQNAQPRSSALFELGWVCGRMGRDRVCIVSKRGTKLHPDLNGIDRIEFIESVEETVLKLEKVLQAADLLSKERKR